MKKHRRKCLRCGRTKTRKRLRAALCKPCGKVMRVLRACDTGDPWAGGKLTSTQQIAFVRLNEATLQRLRHLGLK